MRWIFLALLSPAIDAVITFVDKYLVEHKVKDSRSMPIYSGIGALVFGTLVWLLAGFPLLSIHNGLLITAAGAVSMAGFPLYFSALSKSHASYINALLQTTPIITLTLSWFVLNEKLLTLQLIGFILVLLAIVAMSIDKVERKIKIDRSFYEILLANLFFAISAILVKFTDSQDSFVSIMAYSSWGLAVGATLLFVVSRKIRNSFFTTFRTTGKPTLAIVFCNESLTALSQAILFLAYTLGPVALVSVLGGTQVFWAILFGITLTILFPKIFREEIAKRDIFAKVSFSLILFVGIWFIGGK